MVLYACRRHSIFLYGTENTEVRYHLEFWGYVPWKTLKVYNKAGLYKFRVITISSAMISLVVSLNGVCLKIMVDWNGFLWQFLYFYYRLSSIKVTQDFLSYAVILLAWKEARVAGLLQTVWQLILNRLIRIYTVLFAISVLSFDWDPYLEQWS